jgi:hypothetical protein
MFRALRGQVELYIDADKKAIGERKDIKPDKKKSEFEQLKKDRIDHLKETKKLIPDMVGDFRKRLNDAKIAPEQKEKLETDKATAWVFHPAEYIEKWKNLVLDKADEEKLEEEIVLEKKQTQKPEERPHGFGMVEFSKFKEVETDLMKISETVEALANKLRASDIPAPKSPESKSASGGSDLPELKSVPIDETMKNVNIYFEKLKKEHEKLMEEADSKEEKAKERTKLKEIEQIANSVNHELKEPMEKFLPSKNPPVQLANVIAHELDWFKKLHSLYRGVLWFHTKIEEIPEEERHNLPKPTDKKGAIEHGALVTLHSSALSLRTEALSKVTHFYGMDIHSKAAYGAANVAMKACMAFAVDCADYFERYKTYLNEQGMRRATLSDSIRRIAVELGEQMTIKDFDKIFPKEETIAKINKIGDPQIEKWAKEELEDIYTFFKKSYLNPGSKLKSMAEESKEAPQEMMAKIIPGVLDVFVKTWSDVGKTQEEHSSKWTEKYEYLTKMIKHLQERKVFPDLALSKVTDVPKGISSRKSVVDYIEKNWLVKTPKEILKLFRDNEHLKGEGGGGSSGGGRQKEHLPIVSGIQEIIDHDLVELLTKKEETPEKFLNELMKQIGNGLRHHTKSTDEIVDLGTVVTSVLAILKDIPRRMTKIKMNVPGVKGTPGKPYSPGGMTKHLKAEEIEAAKEPERHFGPSPKTKEPRETPSHLKYLTQPGPLRIRPSGYDITITRLQEARDLKDKVDKLHSLLEKIVAPEKIETIYPHGLLDGLDQLLKEEHKGIHAPTSNPKEEEKARKAIYLGPSTPQTFRIAEKFAGVVLPNEDDVTSILS